MEIYCTRPGCPRPVNQYPDLDNKATLKTSRQRYCTACGMELILKDRYIPLKLLGRGGFGAAFLARDRYTPAMRLSVVKQFQPAGNLSADQLQLAQNLFEREGEVLEDLGRHPQIPDLYAFFEIDPPPGGAAGQPNKFFYLVQEYIDGQTLEEMLSRTGTFSEAEVTQLLLAILPVLKFVHDSHSIHRDIKPSNIIRSRDGTYYLLDFGAVKQVTSGAAVGAQPGRSTGIYSMGFAPPEQMRGDRVYPATDLYALAVTCIMMLTGKDPADLYDNYSDRWNWRAYAQVSDRLEAILNQLLQAAPNQRFQSATEVLQALQPPAPPPPKPSPTAVQAAPSPPIAPPPAAPAAPAAPRKSRKPIASPQVPPPIAPPPAPLRKSAAGRRAVRSFSLPELIGNAAFTGSEGGVVAIAAASLLGTTSPTWLAITGMAIAGLVVAQYLRWIEKIDLIIIGTVSLGVVAFFSPLHSILTALGLAAGATLPQVLQVLVPLVVLGGLGVVAIALIFRLIYTVLSRFM
ncbi:MAG: serine/threonine protein kinase [Oscillatoriophycideae cyanobacterium NC_groundwater_1537_Pr4_S-0.65um_50_18]|nr:serine/threonine protein kinase [Oscillatoriophycideae cyanobacterium NC_groundwater_1537_Pr4_S-0.65um_50_18]